MARRSRRPDGGDPGGRRRPGPARDRLPELPDPRAVERHLHRLLGGGADPATPRGQALELLGRAFEEQSTQRRLDLARQALALWPDCADAYVLLAEHAPRRQEALALYQQGVAAGERAVGPAAFQRDAGSFWAILETRPYMRARLGLAVALWEAGRRPEAVQHLQDLLRLNPNDNQGVRYTLAACLLALDRDDDLARLLGQYPDEASAAWAYTQALLAFRQGGDSPQARRLLAAAKESNRHVPAYLLDRKFPAAELPACYSPGDDREALHYLAGNLAGWKATPGAVAWLRSHDERTLRRQAAAPRPRGPLPLVKNWLRRKLPQGDDVWQAGCRQVANAVRLAGEKVRPWLALVTSRTSGLVLAQQVFEEEPAAASLWDTLVRAMQNPAAGEPHRPAELQVRAGQAWQALRPHIEEVGITLVPVESLGHLDPVFQAVSEAVGGKAAPGLLDMPGVTAAQVASFYAAAAAFFRQAPWQGVGYESALRVGCGQYPSGPWYAVLMGQSGLTSGLALYEDLDRLQEAWRQPARYQENLRESVATTVTFGEEVDVALADVQAARRHGWEVARADAWPLAFHKERGLSQRPPLAWELELLEGCLRAVPEFAQRRSQDDPSTEEVTVPLASGELKLVLSWVDEPDGGP